MGRASRDLGYGGWLVVPDLVGLTAGEAMSAVDAIGLRIAAVAPDGDERPLRSAHGTVVNQDPPAGRPVNEGHLILVWISASDADNRSGWPQ